MRRKAARTFKDLVLWQKANEFVLEIYNLTHSFPKKEIYCLTMQVSRAAVSIPANIAEGFKKRGKKDKARFMNISQGSVEGCRYYLILSEDLGYCDSRIPTDSLEQVSKLLDAYTKSILNSDS